MKIAFDMDDTITAMPRLFSVITNSLISSGHEVFVITDSHENWRQYKLNWLKENNIAFTKMFILGNKAEFCKQNGIEFLLDDCIEYFDENCKSFTEFPIIIGEIDLDF